MLTYPGYIHQHAQTWSDDYKPAHFDLSLCYLTQEKEKKKKNPGGVCWGGTLLVDWLGTWHSMRISASLSCSQCAADWLPAVDLITLRLLAVTLRWEADASKPRGGICMSGRAWTWTVHAREASCAVISPSPSKLSSQHCVTSIRHAVEFITGRLPLPRGVLPWWQCFIFCCAGQVFISQIKCVSGATYHSSGRSPSFHPLCPQRDPRRCHGKDTAVAIHSARKQRQENVTDWTLKPVVQQV